MPGSARTLSVSDTHTTTGDTVRTLATTVAAATVCALTACGSTTDPATDPTPRYATPSATDPLVARARAHGTVRVTVVLDIAWQPESGLTAAQISRQRTAIADAEDTLLAQLSPYRYHLVSRSRTEPRLTLDADAPATTHLRHSALVATLTPTP